MPRRSPSAKQKAARKKFLAMIAGKKGKTSRTSGRSKKKGK